MIAELPAHLDSDGLVKYFPTCLVGSDTLTAYMLSVSNEAGWDIPTDVKDRMLTGLRGFIEGKVIRWSALPTADVSIRKMAALEALSRYDKAEPKLLGSITLEPNLWPTSAVIDWMNVLMRVAEHAGAGQEDEGSGADHPFAPQLPGDDHGLLHGEDRLLLVAHGVGRRERGQNGFDLPRPGPVEGGHAEARARCDRAAVPRRVEHDHRERLGRPGHGEVLEEVRVRAGDRYDIGEDRR